MKLWERLWDTGLTKIQYTICIKHKPLFLDNQ
jgi:hypothetical protein